MSVCDVTLVSSDRVACTIPAAVAWQRIGLLKSLIALDDGGCAEMPPVELDYSSEVLRAVREYVTHPDPRTMEIPKPLTSPLEHIVKAWEIEFVRDAERRHILLLLSECACYLRIEELQSLLMAWVAQRIEEISKAAPSIMEGAEQIRQYLNIENEWTPEEMVHLEKEMKYAKEIDPGAY